MQTSPPDRVGSSWSPSNAGQIGEGDRCGRSRHRRPAEQGGSHAEGDAQAARPGVECLPVSAVGNAGLASRDLPPLAMRAQLPDSRRRGSSRAHSSSGWRTSKRGEDEVVLAAVTMPAGGCRRSPRPRSRRWLTGAPPGRGPDLRGHRRRRAMRGPTRRAAGAGSGGTHRALSLVLAAPWPYPASPPDSSPKAPSAASAAPTTAAGEVAPPRADSRAVTRSPARAVGPGEIIDPRSARPSTVEATASVVTTRSPLVRPSGAGAVRTWAALAATQASARCASSATSWGVRTILDKRSSASPPSVASWAAPVVSLWPQRATPAAARCLRQSATNPCRWSVS